MAVFFALVLFACGLFLIIKGGDILVRAALRLNQVTGINQVIIGATFVSIATTLPEVFVSIFAVIRDNHGIAVGNAIGSMIANVALVLALSLAFLPQKYSRKEILGKSLFLLLITIIVFLFALNLKMSWYEGLILLTAFAVFLMFNARAAQPQGQLLTEPVKPKHERGVYWKIALGFIIGQLMLVAGAFVLVENGERIAHLFNISETVIGFTIIAVGTSLPELTTAIVSIKRKSGGLAIGNVIGANIINCTLLLGVCGIIGDINGSELPVSRETVFIAIPVLMVLSAIAILPMILKRRTYRWQGFVLLALYAAYISYLVVMQPA